MKKYISNVEKRCPICNNIINNYLNTEIDDDLIAFHYECTCGCRGIEYHKIIFTGHAVHDDEIDDLDLVNNYVPIEPNKK